MAGSPDRARQEQRVNASNLLWRQLERSGAKGDCRDGNGANGAGGKRQLTKPTLERKAHVVFRDRGLHRIRAGKIIEFGYLHPALKCAILGKTMH